MANSMGTKGRSVWEEFRAFISRGNMIDLAVGIIIGTAFKDVVNSLVKDIIMPPIGLLLAGVDFTNLFVKLTGGDYASLADAEAAGAATLNYGRFINTIIDFLIMAAVIFFLVKALNKMQRQKAVEPAAPTTKTCPHCFTSIPIQATRCPNCTSQL